MEQRRDSYGNRKENIFVLGVQGKRIRKAHCNREIYKELCEKYKISRYKVENPDDYDIVLDRTPGYNHSTYSVIKNNTELSQLELALICDDGNLCFGYTMQGSQFYIFED